MVVTHTQIFIIYIWHHHEVGLCCAREHLEQSAGGISPYPNVSPEANWRTGVPKPSAPVNGTLVATFKRLKSHNWTTYRISMIEPESINLIRSKKHGIHSPPPWTQSGKTDLLRKWESKPQSWTILTSPFLGNWRLRLLLISASLMSRS